MNLAALVSLAALGEKAGVDLWNFQTTDGRGIRQAINYLYPFASGTKKWEYQQIEPLEPERLFSSMRLAARQYHDAQFAKMLATLPPSAAGKHILLNF